VFVRKVFLNPAIFTLSREVHMMNKARLVVLLGAVLALLACGGAKEKPTPMKSAMAQEFEGAPAWVTKGCAAYQGEKAAICGVGSAGGTRNPSLAMSAAEGRARTAIARSLQVKVKSMLKDYQATTTGGEDFGTAAADEQHIVDVSKQITNMTLSGTQRVDSWISPNGTLYVLMKLDVDAFKDAVSGMKQLDEKVRKAVIERAEKAFKELDEATAGE
jgi:hypothetical protein